MILGPWGIKVQTLKKSLRGGGRDRGALDDWAAASAHSLLPLQGVLNSEPPPPPLQLPASPSPVVMTIWSKYFDVSGMIRSRLALHRT